MNARLGDWVRAETLAKRGKFEQALAEIDGMLGVTDDIEATAAALVSFMKAPPPADTSWVGPVTVNPDGTATLAINSDDKPIAPDDVPKLLTLRGHCFQDLVQATKEEPVLRRWQRDTTLSMVLFNEGLLARSPENGALLALNVHACIMGGDLGRAIWLIERAMFLDPAEASTTVESIIAAHRKLLEGPNRALAAERIQVMSAALERSKMPGFIPGAPVLASPSPLFVKLVALLVLIGAIIVYVRS